jgi:hypothetical protein
MSSQPATPTTGKNKGTAQPVTPEKPPQQKAIETVKSLLDALKIGDPQYQVYDYNDKSIIADGPHNIKLNLIQTVKAYTESVKQAIEAVKTAIKDDLATVFYDIQWANFPRQNIVATLTPAKSPLSTSAIQSQPSSQSNQPIASASSSTSLTAPFAQLNLSQATLASQAGPSAPPQYAPSVAPTQALSIVSQLSMSSQDVRRALGKIKTGLDADISESEFRDILKKNPSILRLAKRSAEEGLTGVRSLSELRNAMQELTTLNEIQHSSYYTVDGEKPLRIKESRPVPTQFQIVSGNRSRKPVGL